MGKEGEGRIALRGRSLLLLLILFNHFFPINIIIFIRSDRKSIGNIIFFVFLFLISGNQEIL
jgi:hypothetical protein